MGRKSMIQSVNMIDRSDIHVGAGLALPLAVAYRRQSSPLPSSELILSLPAVNSTDSDVYDAFAFSGSRKNR
jgi:hypothetical protein